MKALIKRNLLLYFRNKSGVFFSILGALISFILYLIFLKDTMTPDWPQLSQTNQLLDTWLISGTLTVTAITTTLTSLTQVVKDRETKVFQDLLLTDIGARRLQLSYLFSATLIGMIMQVLLFVVMLTYFYYINHTVVSLFQSMNVFLLMFISALLSAALNLALIQQMKTVDTLAKFSSIVGTAAGFLVGTYVPMGALPDFAQTLMKLTPGSYIASLYRQILLTPTLSEVLKDNPAVGETFEEAMGVRLKITELLTFQQTYILVILILLITLQLALLPRPLKKYKEHHALFRQ
mgnify:CR=1 FL=1